MAAASAEEDVAAGTTIVREGDEADALYVLVDGRADVCARGERGGAEEHLRVLEVGAVFGEIGLLEHMPRTATVTALKDSRLLRIDGEAFLDGLTAIPATGVLLEDARSRLARTHPSRLRKADPVEAG
jgi:NTE family protein